MVNELEMVEKEVKKFDIAGCRFFGTAKSSVSDSGFW